MTKQKRGMCQAPDCRIVVATCWNYCARHGSELGKAGWFGRRYPDMPQDDEPSPDHAITDEHEKV